MSVDPFLLVFILCPVIVIALRVKKNAVELQKDKDMVPFERQKDYIRRTILLKGSRGMALEKIIEKL